MVFQCVVPNCRGNQNNGPKLSTFSFPIDQEQQRKWVSAIQKDLNVTRSIKVCELHFKAEDIRRTVEYYCEKTGKITVFPLDVPRLRKNAIPSVFPESPGSSMTHSNNTQEPGMKRRRLENVHFESASANSKLELQAKSQKYCVAVFSQEKKLSILSENWLINSKYSFYPAYDKTEMNNALLKHESPTDDWTIKPCRILKYCNSLKDAKSETEEEDEPVTLPEKRLPKLPARLRDSILQPQPKRKKQATTFLVPSENKSPAKSYNIRPIPVHQIKQEICIEEDMFYIEDTEDSQGNDGENIAEIIEHPSQDLPNNSTEESSQEIMTKLNLIVSEIFKLRAEVNSIRISLQNYNGPVVKNDPTETNLPCTTHDELAKYNMELESYEIFAHNLTKLKTRGGVSEGAIVRRVLGEILTNPLASEYNWVALRGEKEAFKKFKNINRLLFCIAQYHIDDITAAKVEWHIKRWLSRSSDRDGGRQKRDKRKK